MFSRGFPSLPFARDDEMAGEKTLSITCFKVEKAVAMDAAASPKRARIGQ